MLNELGVLLCLGTLVIGIVGLVTVLVYLVLFGCELFREFTRKYFPAKYYYDYEEEV